MNTTTYLRVVPVTFAILIATEIARAQDRSLQRDVQEPAQNAYRPPVSPYLNLLRRGDPALNYYRLVRPEQEFRSGIAGSRAAISRLERVDADREAILRGLERKLSSPPGAASQQIPSLPPTGHKVEFMNSQSYFFKFPKGVQ